MIGLTTKRRQTLRNTSDFTHDIANLASRSSTPPTLSFHRTSLASTHPARSHSRSARSLKACDGHTTRRKKRRIP